MTTFVIVFSIVVFVTTWAYIIWSVFKDNYRCNKCNHSMYVKNIKLTPYEEIRTLKCPECGYEKEIIVENEDYDQF